MVNGLAAIPLWRGMGLRVVHVSTNALDPAEVSSRTDTCQGAITRLLFVGRVEREKGISEAIETCESLRVSGVEAILTVVGPFTDVHLPARSSPAVVFVGPVPFGPELFRRYLDADILLSLSHFESFPRVIWEALGFGLPVVRRMSARSGRRSATESSSSCHRTTLKLQATLLSASLRMAKADATQSQGSSRFRRYGPQHPNGRGRGQADRRGHRPEPIDRVGVEIGGLSPVTVSRRW